MNFDKLSQKLDELQYKISLDRIGMQNAEYNLKFSKRLALSNNQISDYIDKVNYYADKIVKDIKTYEAYKDCAESIKLEGNSDNSNYLFKCTLPYEKVDELSSYQTTITVNENVVRLFANGVDYNDAISCIENKDIKDINTTFKMAPTSDDLSQKEVAVELFDGIVPCEVIDEPVIAKCGKSNTYKGLIASSKIATCYPYNVAKFKDLNGEEYYPNVPSFDDLKIAQENVDTKYAEYEYLHNIEKQVKIKMDDTVNKMDEAILRFESQYDNILK